MQPLRNAAIFIFLLAGAYFVNLNYKESVFKNEIEQNKVERENSITRLEKAIFNLGEIPALTVNIERKTTENFHIIARMSSKKICNFISSSPFSHMLSMYALIVKIFPRKFIHYETTSGYQLPPVLERLMG